MFVLVAMCSSKRAKQLMKVTRPSVQSRWPCLVGLRLLGLVNLDTTAATRIRFASTSSFRNYHRKKGSIIRNKEAGELATFFAVPCADPRSIEIRQQRTLRAPKTLPVSCQGTSTF